MQARRRSARSAAPICAALAPISLGLSIARSACDQTLSAPPSHENQRSKLALTRLGALRSSGARPIARARPSVQAFAGTWQLEHATAPFADSRGSKKRACPSAIARGSPEARLLGSDTF